MAMLMTPDRSHIMPDIDPKTIGTVEMSVTPSRSTRFSVWPRAAQARNDHRNSRDPEAEQAVGAALELARARGGRRAPRRRSASDDRDRAHRERQRAEVHRGRLGQDEGGLVVRRHVEPKVRNINKREQEEEMPMPRWRAAVTIAPRRTTSPASWRANRATAAHAPHPWVSRPWPTFRPRIRYTSFTSAGVATMKTMIAWITSVRSSGIPVVACM